MKGDSLVNHALDCRVSRETEWTRKQSTTVDAEEVFKAVDDLNSVYGVRPLFEDVPATVEKYENTIKEAVKERVIFDNDRALHEHVKTLVQQGHFANLLRSSFTDATWQSFLYDLPKGTMKFLLNSCLNTLPTKANLQKWGKSFSNRCPMPQCGNKQTTNHILSSFKEYLNSGRYLWRHNGIVNYIISKIDKKAFKVYSDLPGYTTPAGGSIPADLLKPDLVIIDNKNKTVEIAELTCPFESRIQVAHNLKTEKYSHFIRHQPGLQNNTDML